MYDNMPLEHQGNFSFSQAPETVDPLIVIVIMLTVDYYLSLTHLCERSVYHYTFYPIPEVPPTLPFVFSHLPNLSPLDFM